MHGNVRVLNHRGISCLIEDSPKGAFMARAVDIKGRSLNFHNLDVYV
jgi:hypothetical protein